MIKQFILCVAAATLSLNGLGGQFEQLAQPARGHVGAAVVLLETGAAADFHGDEQFPMQSVYKLPIGMALLQQVDAGTIKLEQQVRVGVADLVPMSAHSPLRDKYPRGVSITVRELLRYMLVQSDGTASDVLLRLAGGPRRVNAYLRGLGIAGIVVANTEQEFAQDNRVQYRNWATPKAMIELLRAVQAGRGLSASSRALLLQFMTDSVPGAHRLKGLLPAGASVAHKTGTSGTVAGVTAATNDVGLITLPDGRHLAMAVFVSDSPADEATREGVIARLALAAWEWGQAQGR
ncbi:MAG TPA: class A beta-lactamase [Pyrinomonadaceae bacterium]|jgi:beta-lactamase class A